MARTSIEWTSGEDGNPGMSWNVVRGCARASTGCENCYAERQAHRFSAEGQPYAGLTVLGKQGPRWVGAARFVPEMLSLPTRWKKPHHVFVNSMSDIFHRDIANEQIGAVVGVMAACSRHTFQLLTKRADRMVQWFRWAEKHGAGYDLLRCGLPDGLLACAWEACAGDAWGDVEPPDEWDTPAPETFGACWPLPNLWLGVSVEDQQRADERTPLLRETPAALRWLSVEPLLERVELDLEGIDWVVVGGESGPRARQCNRRWIEDVVQQCRCANVPVFVKQLGAAYCDTENAVGGAQTRDAPNYGPIRRLKDRKGADISEWPRPLRFRERPQTRKEP